MLSLETISGFSTVTVALDGQRYKIWATHSPVHQLFLRFIKGKEPMASWTILNTEKKGS